MEMDNPFKQYMQQAKTFQEALKKFQSEIKFAQVTGEAGAGMVKVTLDGHYRVQNMEIDDEVYKEGKAIVISLVMAATNDAADKVKRLQEDKMRQFTSNLGLPPNFNFPFV